METPNFLWLLLRLSSISVPNFTTFPQVVLWAVIDGMAGEEMEEVKELGVDRLSVPILSILPIIDIGHFKNRFADNFFFFFFYANKHTIYR